MEKRKIGIMGGAFDPIHLGHLVAANEVLNTYQLNEIIFVPTGNPPHKNGLIADSLDRYVMVSMAVLSNDKFSVSDIEISSREKSYTLNTLRKFREIYKGAELYFITGADAIIDLANWHQPSEILKLCKLIAVSRPGIGLKEVQDKIKDIQLKYGGTIEIVQIPMLQISSTEIRKRFKKGISAKYLLPESVEQYIIKNKIYMKGDTLTLG
ncbi:MAG TPA: nicotinate-nucleotide adenylyltransferase [Tissierellia bacterium]|jgi:nicotinate-nucleotide adenylyltransferase|nr:nicotinate-nucleotide adenylyltransferase [Tissierellia bacterium]